MYNPQTGLVLLMNLFKWITWFDYVSITDLAPTINLS